MLNSIQVTCRHNAILARLQECGYISTEDLAREFNVSVHTIRRDLNILESQHQLRRCHGGAGELNKSGNSGSHAGVEQIMAVAQAIVDELEAGSCLYIDSPSIGEALVGLLPEDVFYLITQHIELIGVAQKNPFIGVFFLGRELSPGDADASIQMAMTKWLTRRVDYCIVEADYIDNDGIFFDDCFHRASVKRHFLQWSQRQYVVCRKEADARRSLVKLGTAGRNKRVFLLTQEIDSVVIGERV